MGTWGGEDIPTSFACKLLFPVLLAIAWMIYVGKKGRIILQFPRGFSENENRNEEKANLCQ